MFIFLIALFFNFYDLHGSVSFLKNKKFDHKKTDNLFWHLDFFNSDNFIGAIGRNIQIVILDIGSNNQACTYCKDNIESIKKMSINQRKEFFLSLYKNDQDRCLYKVNKKYSLKKIIKEKHAEITANLIQQIAPEAHIEIISIQDKSDSSLKIEFYKALKRALKINPDILHVGIQILDFNTKEKIDKKIVHLLKKFKTIIAPAGNNGHISKKVGFPANCPFVTSVGSLGIAQGTRGCFYKVSEFCQTDNKIDIFMPGEDIATFIWAENLKKSIFIKTSGTSMAAALATGKYACLLENNPRKHNFRE